VAADGEPDAQRVAGKEPDDDEVAELPGAPPGREAEENQQKRRGQDPRVGGRDRGKVGEAAVQRGVRPAAGSERRVQPSDQGADRSERPQLGVRGSNPAGVSASARPHYTARIGRNNCGLTQFCGDHSLTTHPEGMRVTCA